MLKNLTELREFPFVKDFLSSKLTKSSAKLFSGNLHAFLQDEDFRTKLGFEKTVYSPSEVTNIIRQIIYGSRFIEYDSGTLTEFESQQHPFNDEISKALQKVSQIIGDKSFPYIVPLTILVKKERLGSWQSVRAAIEARIKPYFKQLNREDMLNCCSGIYRIKTQPRHLGLLFSDDRLASIPALATIADKGTVNHETVHFIQNLFYSIPSAEVGGLAGFFSGHPELYSLFNVEFLPYLVQYGDADVYKSHLHNPEKLYPFAYPEKIDEGYNRKLDNFANQVKIFIANNPDGLLSLIVFYPVYCQQTHRVGGTMLFDVPDNAVEDIRQFKEYLAKYGHHPTRGIIRNSGLGTFIIRQFEQYSKEWYEIYKSQKNF